MRIRISLSVAVGGLVLMALTRTALAGNDGIAQVPTTAPVFAGGSTVTFAMSAATTDTSWAVPIYNVEFINPADGGLPILVDGIAFTVTAGALAGEVAGVKVTLSGADFTNTDSVVTDANTTIVTSFTANALGFDIDLGVGDGAATANSTADVLTIAEGDTVRLTLYAYGTAITDASSFTVDISTDADIVVDASGASFATTTIDGNPTTVVGYPATSLATTDGDPGGLGLGVNVASVATSKSVAVPVFQFKLTDDETANVPAARPMLIDGLTIPITLGGGMDPADIAGASVEITSSTPVNTVSFSTNSAGSTGDREINTADDPNAIQLTTVGSNRELRLGTAASIVYSGASTADLLAIPDPGTADTDYEVVLTVKIWLATSGLTANSTATFSLDQSGVTLSGAVGTNTDPINPYAQVTEAVATIIVADNENTTVSDRGAIPNSLALSSSAIDVSSAVGVFDFSITDGIGGQSTKIDSLSIPVTMSGGAKFSDLAGAKLAIDNGAGITLAFVGASSIDLTNNPTLVSLDSVSATQALITFKGQATIDTTDAVADLLEIPDGGASVAFTASVWLDTSDVAYGATFTFDLQNEHITLTGQTSDGLASGQDVTNTVVTIAVARIIDVATVADPTTISSAAIADATTPDPDGNASAVFDFQIVDPLDGVGLQIDAIRLPLTFGGGADISDIAGVKAVISGLSTNDWGAVGAPTTTVESSTDVGIIEIDPTAVAIDIGSLVAATGGVDALTVPDGETATVTISLWLSTASLVDSSTVTLSLDRDGILLAGTTTGVAASQTASGTAAIRATRLADNTAIPTATSLSNVNIGTNSVAVFGFEIIDPADGVSTKIDQIVLTAAGTGADPDITDVLVTVSGAFSPAFTSGADDALPSGTLQLADAGMTDSGTFPVALQTITMGGAADGDGMADLIEIADGTTATFVVSVINAGLATATDAIAFDLTTASVTVDGGDVPGSLGSAIATAQDLTDKTVTVTSATTLIADLATVGDAVSVSSVANLVGDAVAVYDFTITDNAAGVAPTNIDGLTIPVVLNGIDFTDIAGVVVTTSGTFSATSDDVTDNVLTSGVDAGVELASAGTDMNILLGSHASGVTAVANAADLIAANSTSINITVAVYLVSTSGALTDGSTMTFSLGSSNFTTDGGVSDTIIPAQSITPGVGTIAVVADRLIFTAPTVTTLAANGVSDTVKVAATDLNSNIDTDYGVAVSVSTNTGTGQFSQNGSAFLGTSTPLSATPTNGVLAFYYKDSAVSGPGTPTLTATSGTLPNNGTLGFTVQTFTLDITWTSPAVGDTTATDSSGTYQRLQYTVTSNDPNLLIEFWASTSPTLTAMPLADAIPLKAFNPDTSTVLGKLRNPTGGAYGPGTNKTEATDVPISGTSQYVYTSSLGVGTWYVYMVRADGDGVSDGGDTLACSGALSVLHFPAIVAFGATESQDGTVDDGTGFLRDSGGTSPNTTLDLLLYAEDHNSNDSISVYVSTQSGLTASTVASDSTTYRLSGTTGWRTNDVTDTLRYATVTISDSLGSSAYHPKGTYYFYALVTDASDSSVTAFSRAQNLGATQQYMTVNHAPTLTFSEPAAAIASHSVAAQPQLTLAWNGSGAAGDQDIDDNASISLWFAVADSTPDAFADTSEAWLKQIITGLAEDPDGGANDQYAWNLTQFDGQLPAAGTPIKVWALVEDAGTTPVFIASEQITFAAYDPSLVLLNPPPGPATEMRESETYRFMFDADYVSDASTNAIVRYFISSADTTSLDAAPANYFTFDTGASSTFPGNYNAFWISGQSALQEGVHRYFDWTPEDDGNNYAAEIVPQTPANATFYLYAVMNTSGAAITSANSLKLARAPGTIKVNGIGASLSAPATSASPNQAQVTAGDTIRVLLRGNTSNTSVQGVQLYVNLDSTQFAIVDQDASTSGVQPFGFETSYFFGSVTAQINRVNLDSLTYKLDLNKRNLSAPADPTGQVMAHIDLVARSFSGAAYVNWNLDRVNDPNRIPLFYNASGDLGALFANPLATFAPLSRGTISGSIPLQGLNRTTDAKVTTFWLRRPGSWISITDTTFINANDDSSSTEGVQLTTAADGSFALTQVPAGTYELVAKSESYLAGYAQVSVVNGQTVTGVTPTRISDTNDPGQLLGGDINGDNKIDTSDESALNLAYEGTAADSSSGYTTAADIDDDGTVLLGDLLILAANLQTPLLTGVEPVYKPAVNDGIVLSLSGVPSEIEAGGEFAVDLQLEGAELLAGYSLGLEFDPTELELVGAQTALLDGRATVKIQRLLHPGRFVLAEAVRGGRDVEVGDPRLAQVRFRALGHTVNPTLRAERAYLADQTGSQVGLTVRVTRALPQRFALLQNTPNPFNPSTQITFDVPGDGAVVSLTIYNVMGQPIRHLVHADGMPSGRYDLTWDGRDDEGRAASSGVYLYTLRAGSFVQSHKMVMMK